MVQVLGLAPGASRAFRAGPGEGTLLPSGLQPHKEDIEYLCLRGSCKDGGSKLFWWWQVV